MKIHLAWIRVTAAAVIVAGAGAQPAAAQYAPYRPIPQQPAAPQPATARPAPTAVQAPYVPYVASRPQTTYQAPTNRYQAPVTPYQSTSAAQYPQPTYPQPTPAYPQPTPAYPQTATQYPANYGMYPYVAQQPTEAAGAATNAQAGNGAAGVETMPAPANPNGGSAAQNYGGGDYYNSTGAAAGACGCNGGTAAAGCNGGTYPDYGISNYFDDGCGCDSQWFGGVYFLYMNRDQPSPVKLTVEVDHAVAPNPYYPTGTSTVVSTHDVDYDFREGAEVRFGCTFSIGDSCDSCNSGCGGNGYSGCNACGPTCGPKCPPTVFAWEVAWWGLNDSPQDYIFEDQPTTRIYGMKNFVGLQYDRDGAGAGYTYRPVNEYYDYGLPIPTPVAPVAGYVAVLAQRVRTDFKAQNLELNVIRFPMCDTCNSGCGGGDSCGCGSNYTGCESSGCDDDCGGGCAFSMYGSCGVRYFRVDDMFSYDTEFAEYDGAAYDQAAYDGFSYDNSNELCYDVDVENQLIGPQVGWTTNYCVGCRWNFFCNSTFGVFNNHINNLQRMWSGGGGEVQFSGSGDSFNVRSSKDDIAFLGELRLGGAYDITCHWRAVAAYRAVAITGLAVSTDQIPDDFSNPQYVALIDSDASMIVHGLQLGVECRY